MELLNPLLPSFPSSSSCSLSVFDTMAAPNLSETVEEVGSGGVGGGDIVFVAVGKSVEKSVSLLRWAIGHFGDKKIRLLHVHRPSPLIPTLLGKLPASQANDVVVDAYRKDEWERTRKLLDNYLAICSKAEGSLVTSEADQVQKGIVELVNEHGIKKLVMGTTPDDNCMKVKKGSRKANYAAKNASLLCEIWFISKGKHVWTREAVKNSDHTLDNNSISVGNSDRIDGESALSFALSNYRSRSFSSIDNQKKLTHSNSKVDEEGLLHAQVREALMEAESSRNEAIAKLSNRKKSELEAMIAMDKVKVIESTYQREDKQKNEAENKLRNAMQEKEKHIVEREKLCSELQRTKRNVALLDSRLQEANNRHEEASEEINLIQSSLTNLWQEKQTIRRQRTEALQWLDRWRRRGQFGQLNCYRSTGIQYLAEFSLAELKAATCNFSKSFKIGQGGYDCLYKGEMMGRTIVVQKLHPQNMHGPLEFQQEVVQVLGKLQHPHLVTLLGLCTEAWSLVYEYIPNWNLHHYLLQKGNNTPPSLTWKARTRIIAEISSALCFLHSFSKPEKIVHGDLTPENILLDSELSVKICGSGICRLVSEDNLCCPSFRGSTEPKGAFSYTDPESQRIGIVGSKSDIYSFGLIILQLLTGRSIIGLVSDIRRAVSSGQLSSLLDSSAGEWPLDVARQLADFGLQFCELKSKDRPELTPSIVRELEHLHTSEERAVPSYYLCPILQEIMHDPQVASDGFTYEGEAIRGWLGSGHDTSPMTNLKLSHSELIPNNAIRIAIQDWLCYSYRTPTHNHLKRL